MVASAASARYVAERLAEAERRLEAHERTVGLRVIQIEEPSLAGRPLERDRAGADTLDGGELEIRQAPQAVGQPIRRFGQRQRADDRIGSRLFQVQRPRRLTDAQRLDVSLNLAIRRRGRSAAHR